MLADVCFRLSAVAFFPCKCRIENMHRPSVPPLYHLMCRCADACFIWTGDVADVDNGAGEAGDVSSRGVRIHKFHVRG